MTSPIYSSPILYRTTMRCLYFPYYKERHASIAAEIEEGNSVVDCCAGDFAIYRLALRHGNVEYMGCDASDAFIAYARKKRIHARKIDMIHDAIPEADVVLMLGSLYQFIPHEKEIVVKLIGAAQKKVIVAEPVRNLAQSGNSVVRWIANRLTRVEHGEVPRRFDERSLIDRLKPLGFQTFKPIAGGRELLAILDKNPCMGMGDCAS